MKIVQCWDDGVVADIRLCEILRKYQAKASFNLNAGLHQQHRSHGWQYQHTWVERLAQNELRQVYEGFTIANHSLTHPDLTHLSHPELDQQIWDNRHRLQDWFDQPVSGFAYPFGGWNEHIIHRLQVSGHIYARTTLNEPWTFPPANPFTFNPTCHFMDEQFWDHFNSAKSTGLFYFWGHSYEMVEEQHWRQFEGKMQILSEDNSCQWADLPELFEKPAQYQDPMGQADLALSE